VEEIVAYQLAVELRDRILTLTKSGPLSKDWKFCNQIRDSARSAPRNLSEGFYRYNHGEFAQFTKIAKSSLGETKNHLEDGKTQLYFTPEDFDYLHRLGCRAIAVSTGLIKHLLSTREPLPYW
jgi:four helix bundle protein